MSEFEVPRDRWDRPLIIPPDGGAPVPYARVTKFTDVLDDKKNLELWQQRMVALGLADRPDLLLAVAAHRDDKRKLNQLCRAAQEAASSSAASTTGTALHAITEQHDRGTLKVVPPQVKDDLDSYIRATEPFENLYIEQFVVNDHLQVGGTPDRVVRYNGRSYIWDLKTGLRVDYSFGKFAMQLGTYSRSSLYDPATGKRTKLDVDQNRGIVAHLPAGSGECTLYWVDIAAGWEGALIAADVQGWRKRKNLAVPFDGE